MGLPQTGHVGTVHRFPFPVQSGLFLQDCRQFGFDFRQNFTETKPAALSTLNQPPAPARSDGWRGHLGRPFPVRPVQTGIDLSSGTAPVYR